MDENKRPLPHILCAVCVREWNSHAMKFHHGFRWPNKSKRSDSDLRQRQPNLHAFFIGHRHTHNANVQTDRFAALKSIFTIYYGTLRAKEAKNKGNRLQFAFIKALFWSSLANISHGETHETKRFSITFHSMCVLILFSSSFASDFFYSTNGSFSTSFRATDCLS